MTNDEARKAHAAACETAFRKLVDRSSAISGAANGWTSMPCPGADSPTRQDVYAVAWTGPCLIVSNISEPDEDSEARFSQGLAAFEADLERAFSGESSEAPPPIRHGRGLLTNIREAAERMLSDGTVIAVGFESVENAVIAASLERRGWGRHGSKSWHLGPNPWLLIEARDRQDA